MHRFALITISWKEQVVPAPCVLGILNVCVTCTGHPSASGLLTIVKGLTSSFAASQGQHLYNCEH